MSVNSSQEINSGHLTRMGLWACLELSRIGLYWILLDFTGFYWILLDFTGFYWILLYFTGFLLDFYWILLDFTGFYWIFTGFYWILLDFTEWSECGVKHLTSSPNTEEYCSIQCGRCPMRSTSPRTQSDVLVEGTLPVATTCAAAAAAEDAATSLSASVSTHVHPWNTSRGAWRSSEDVESFAVVEKSVVEE